MGTFIENNPTIIVATVAAIAGIFYWAGSVRTDVNTIKESIKEIRGNIKEILDKISKISTETLKTQSPPRLNELGLEVSRQLEASKWAKENAPDLFSEVAGKEDYEIQKFSFEYVRKRLTEKWQIKVEICAYERGLVKSDVLDVLAVELRDELLRLKSTNHETDNRQRAGS